MKRMRTYLATIIILAVFVTLLSGCGRAITQEDEPTDFMAWQFVQAIIRPRIERPSNANFPRYSSSFIERLEKNKFVVTSYVNTLNEQSEVVTYDFTVEATYLGKDVFEEESVEIKRRNQ